MAVTIYGPNYSTYVRSVRLLLEELGESYELVEIDIFQGQQNTPEHKARCPFAKVPAVDVDGFMLYETATVMRYVDDSKGGGRFQPGDAKARARMNQAIDIANDFAYSAIVTNIVIPRLVVPMMGGETDMAQVEKATPTARLCTAELARIQDGEEYLAGAEPSLADLMLAPIFAYFSQVPEGAVVDEHPSLKAWWERMAAMPSMHKTAPKLG